MVAPCRKTHRLSAKSGRPCHKSGEHCHKSGKACHFSPQGMQISAKAHAKLQQAARLMQTGAQNAATASPKCRKPTKSVANLTYKGIKSYFCPHKRLAHIHFNTA
jgi:hypothetical protein